MSRRLLAAALVLLCAQPAQAAITFGAAGASACANGVAPTPGLPAGLAAGQVMVTVFGSREAVDGTVAISAGWNEIVNERTANGLIAAWWRVWQTGDAAPTFTLGGHAGGASGDTVCSHIASWAGVDTADPLDVTGTLSGGGTGTDHIGPVTGLALAASDAVVVVGVKRTSWASVATLSGDSLTWAEIGEPDDTSGSDVGLVWDYAIDGGAGTTVTDKTFTVTTPPLQAAWRGVMFTLNVLPDEPDPPDPPGSGNVNVSAANVSAANAAAAVNVSGANVP